MTVILFLVILTVLVVIHEAGHFFTAKKFGIKVEEFGFGFPPRAFGIKKGETVYSINWLPIGGFVKLYGEDEAGSGKIGAPKKITKDLSRAFFVRSAWQRALVILAGVIMNFLLGAVLISFIFAWSGVSVPDKITISEVVKSSPAESAGFLKGDVVKSIDGISTPDSNALISYVDKHKGSEITAKVQRGNSQVDLKVTPRKISPSGQGPLGIGISQNFVLKKFVWYEAIWMGFGEALSRSWLILAGLWMVVSQLVIKASLPAGVAGPVGIAQLTGQVAESSGLIGILNLTSFISINLAVLNILPIPALDGGRLFFILIELITRKKVNPKYEGYAHAAGMIILLGLIALITAHDVIRVVTGQPLLPK